MKRITYYSLQEATESEKIGSWPQLDAPKRYWKVENIYNKVLDYRKFPEVTPNLDNFTLKRG